MSESNDRSRGGFSRWRAVAILFLMVWLVPDMARANQALVKQIDIQKDPLSIQISLSRKIPVKVIQVEKKELLIALKNATLERGFKITGRQKSAIHTVAVDKLPGNVIAVIVTSQHPYEYIQSRFNAAQSSFVVQFEKKSDGKKPIKKIQKKAIQKKKTPPVTATELPLPPKKEIVKKKLSSPLPAPEPLPDKPVKIATPSLYIPPVREQGRFKGDISDLVRSIEDLNCDAKQIQNSILLLKKNLYQEAFDILDVYIDEENTGCREQAYFLRAYAFYKGLDRTDFARLLKAERLFQDALVAYPRSDHLAYGYSAIGMIQKSLNNASAAEGYFNLVKQGYLAYHGLAEVMYHLADIYDQKGYLDKALRYYKQVFEDPVENDYTADAGIGYGRLLFKKRQYRDSLAVLNYVVQSSPKKVYDSHELLLHIGNAAFEIGQSRTARKTLSRVLNLFPDIEGRDIIFSKIGDTYGMENDHEKAIKVYDLVREKFPDSEGYIASSIGIARYLEKDQEKIDVYAMIKEKFPENKFARIAMMRLAEIYQANGEYDRCIKEIEDLLSTHPRGLRYEAVKLMQRAYEALFQQQLESDEYTKVLNRYETEHTRIDRMGSRKIALNVGLAYLEAKLYEPSFNHLIDAYKQYKRASRSPELLLGLAIAMDESGRDDDALKLLDAFSARFPNHAQRGQALSRAGNICLEKKKYALAAAKFDTAYKMLKTRLEKGNVLIRHAIVYEQKKDMHTASVFRERAIKEMALASGENYDALTHAYKELGRTYLALERYGQSADAYSKALSFSADDRERANLGFLVGDAYQKGNSISEAKKAFEQVVILSDSVWARLAQQRLNTLELAQAVQNS